MNKKKYHRSFLIWILIIYIILVCLNGIYFQINLLRTNFSLIFLILLIIWILFLIFVPIGLFKFRSWSVYLCNCHFLWLLILGVITFNFVLFIIAIFGYLILYYERFSFFKTISFKEDFKNKFRN